MWAEAVRRRRSGYILVDHLLSISESLGLNRRLDVRLKLARDWGPELDSLREHD
jgi:hypothetical protein